MLIMRELNRELTRGGWIAKDKPCLRPRTNLTVADSADYGTRAAEKLRPMTTYTGVMIGIIRNVWKLSHLLPVASGSLVTGVTGLLVFFCSVRKR
jgi:hypothetical protein